MPKDAVYLGDGAYAKWREETGELVVFTSNGIFTTNSVYLEPSAIAALLEFIQRSFKG